MRCSRTCFAEAFCCPRPSSPAAARCIWRDMECSVPNITRSEASPARFGPSGNCRRGEDTRRSGARPTRAVALDRHANCARRIFGHWVCETTRLVVRPDHANRVDASDVQPGERVSYRPPRSRVERRRCILPVTMEASKFLNASVVLLIAEWCRRIGSRCRSSAWRLTTAPARLSSSLSCTWLRSALHPGLADGGGG